MQDLSRTVFHDGPRGDVTQRNIWWSMLLTRLLMNNEDLRREFPKECTVMLLPEGDDELVHHNLKLYRLAKSERPVILVNIGVHDAVVDIQSLNAGPRREYALG